MLMIMGSLLLVILLVLILGNQASIFGGEPSSTPQLALTASHTIETQSADDLVDLLVRALATPTPMRGAGPVRRVRVVSFMMGEEVATALTTCAETGVRCGLDWFTDEQPVHSVKLSTFYMDQFEVTNAQYGLCVQAGACKPPSNLGSATRNDYFTNPAYADYPVVNVSWQAAQDYCSWHGGRLPSEAEWEGAARGRLERKLFPWGDDLPVCQEDAANGAHFQSDGCKTVDTAAAGSYDPNEYRLYDMAGNVMEWTADWYNEFYYATLLPDALSPPGPLTGNARVVRGGAWDSPAYMLRVATRTSVDPNQGADNIGFRCVIDE
jgi:formylglycine-generating enzyme required for sulfatase activity